MPQVVIENPVINSPFEEPKRHFRFDEQGITNQIEPARRISQYFVPIAKPRSARMNKAAAGTCARVGGANDGDGPWTGEIERVTRGSQNQESALGAREEAADRAEPRKNRCGRRDAQASWASSTCIANNVLSSRAWNASLPRFVSCSSPKSHFISLCRRSIDVRRAMAFRNRFESWGHSGSSHGRRDCGIVT